MNLPPARNSWDRLVAAAREGRDDRDASAPYGFATRVTALAFSQPLRSVSLLERFALRAVAVASLLAVGSVALNYNSISVPQPDRIVVAADDGELSGAADDAVAIVLDFAD